MNERSSLSVARAAFTLMSLIPGLGHVALGRCMRGVMMFLAFTTILNATLMAPLFLETTQVLPVRWGLSMAAGLVFLYAVGDALRLTYWHLNPCLTPRKNPVFREGLTHFLRQEYDAAANAFRHVLRIDHDDPDAHFLLGCVWAESGDAERARKAFARCLHTDPDRKWAWEVSEEYIHTGIGMRREDPH